MNTVSTFMSALVSYSVVSLVDSVVCESIDWRNEVIIAQSVFLCLTRPVFSQEMDIFNVIVRNKSTKPYHYLDSYRLIGNVVKMSTTFYLSFKHFGVIRVSYKSGDNRKLRWIC